MPPALSTPTNQPKIKDFLANLVTGGVSKKAAATAAKQAHGKALAEVWRLEDALAAAWAEEARLLGAAEAAREADYRRKQNLRQLKSVRVRVVDLTVDRGSREARRQVTLAQLAAGTAVFMN